MKVIPCPIPGLLLIEPKVFGDPRGFFMELWNQRDAEELGIQAPFVQDNVSFSRRGILRGMHFQNPHVQAKLVTVFQGEVFDVVVDLRRGSPSFGQWYGTNLSAENKRLFFIPRGFAHGFAVLSETALFHYKCSEFYSPQDEGSFRWDDPEIGIEWPIRDPLLSEKDARAPWFRDVPRERFFKCQ
jgi:dTDP-4-dehydrorhamnose 3,5-epimerase